MIKTIANYASYKFRGTIGELFFGILKVTPGLFRFLQQCMGKQICELSLEYKINNLRIAQRYDDALNFCKKILETLPNHPGIIYLLGELYLDVGSIDDARIALNKLSRLQSIDRLAFKVSLQLSHNIICKEQKLKSQISTPIEYPYYLYQNDWIFTALHPHYQNIINHPPNHYRFQTDVHALVITSSHSSILNPAKLAIDISYGKMNRVPILYQSFFKAFLSTCKEFGVKSNDIAKFLSSRALIESFAVPPSVSYLLLPGYPFFVGPQSWSVAIESWHTLYYPFIPNDSEGSTYNFDYENSPSTKILKALFSQDNCVAIITHMKSTHMALSKIFKDSNIPKKIRYIPIGYPTPPFLKERQNYSIINLLYINSHGAGSSEFILRGGLEVLHAFRHMNVKDNNLHLTICGQVPWQILTADETHFLRNCSHVSLKESYMSEQEMLLLLHQADVFLIPANALRSISVVQALAYGIPVIASDGWGFDEFIDDGVTGFLAFSQVKHSYVDKEGIVRIDNRRPYRIDEVLVESIIEKVMLFSKNVDLLKEMSNRARFEARQRFSIDKRNNLMMEIFDHANLRDEC